MKFDALHWIQVAMMMVIGGAGSVAQAVPQWSQVCIPIIAGAVGIMGSLGMVSHSIMGTTVPNPPTKLVPQSANASIMVMS